MKTEIYVQYGVGGSSMRTEQVEVKVDDLYHHKRGLSYTASGYSNRLPTIYRVFVEGRWRRVYSRCFSDTSSEFVIIDGQEVSVIIYQGN